MTYAELEARANQSAHLFRKHGLQPGDRVAFILENRLEIFPFVWGAQRAGLLYIAISSHLTADEIGYILEDSGAKMVLTSDYISMSVQDMILKATHKPICYKLDRERDGFNLWSDALADQSTEPISQEGLGADMLYSSGTTGRPKGVVPTIDHTLPADTPSKRVILYSKLFSFDEETIYLCPAPLYHAAPLRWTLLIHQVGGTAIVMEKFDATEALSLIDTHSITHGLFVPIHFVRMLKLDDEVRSESDLSSLHVAVHAGAPCAPETKRAMMAWWGPILYEYYAGSEGNGFVASRPQDWLDRPGTVGRPVIGSPRICDDAGEPLPIGKQGTIYFEGGPKFKYNNDPEKTAGAYNKHGWSTLGDVGRLDEEGYLYLTGRKSFTIISGGVNIYPQEIENRILAHPSVRDVAVVGLSDPEYGQKVVAIIEPMKMISADEDLKKSIQAFCRETLSGIKTPRQIDFIEKLPRTETGKIRKQSLLDLFDTGDASAN